MTRKEALNKDGKRPHSREILINKIYDDFENKTKCHWKKKMTMFGYNNWLSGCRIEVGFNPTKFKYCPYCGREIEFLEGTITV